MARVYSLGETKLCSVTEAYETAECNQTEADLSVPEKYKGAVERLIQKNLDLFAERDTELDQTDIIKMRIDTGDQRPIPGSRGSVSGRALDFGFIGVSTCGFESHQGPFRSLTFPPVLRDWVIKGFGMSSLVYATGHIKDPVPLIEKRRGVSPGGRFPPSFIHHHHWTE